MQSIRLSKAVIYTIPDKVRWDAWWLIPPAIRSCPRHASACWHPRLSIDNPDVRQNANPKPLCVTRPVRQTARIP
jgi:hypothetical protein